MTDGQDRRLIGEILKGFYHRDIEKEDYKFSESGIYYAPNASTIEETLA